MIHYSLFADCFTEGNEEDENKPSEKISIIDIGKEDIKGSDDEEEEEVQTI